VNTHNNLRQNKKKVWVVSRNKIN